MTIGILQAGLGSHQGGGAEDNGELAMHRYSQDPHRWVDDELVGHERRREPGLRVVDDDADATQEEPELIAPKPGHTHPEPTTSGAEDPVRRVTRELEAAKARVERDAQRVYDATREELVAKLLPILDNLDRSIAAARTEGDKGLLQGTALVRNELESVLSGFGLERFEADGLPFDPREHEAIAVENIGDPRLDGVVIEQFRPGYRFGGRLLRAAQVKVAKVTPGLHEAPRPNAATTARSRKVKPR